MCFKEGKWVVENSKANISGTKQGLKQFVYGIP